MNVDTYGWDVLFGTSTTAGDGYASTTYHQKNMLHDGQNENVQKDKQRSIKHTHSAIDRVTQSPLKTEGELWSSEG
jgi:hypothetical protein